MIDSMHIIFESVFMDAHKFSKRYGGDASDWVKKRSDQFQAKDGTSFRTHWVENIKSGERVEFKTKIHE